MVIIQENRLKVFPISLIGERWLENDGCQIPGCQTQRVRERNHSKYSYSILLYNL